MSSENFSDVQVLTIGSKEKAIIANKNGKSYRIDIKSPGTKDGFSAMNDNKADICMASASENVPSTIENVIGLDGIAVITNVSNPIECLSKDGLKTIFSGNADWEGVPTSKASGKINIYRMGDKTGIFKMFKELVMRGSDINGTDFAKSEEMVNAVAKDPNGIGFVSYTFLSKSSGIKEIPISDAENLPCIYPNALTIASEKYPLCRRLYMYRPASSNNSYAASFARFVTSNQGQTIVENSGFINLSVNSDKDIQIVNDDPLPYRSLINSGAEKLTTEFRFKTGSNDLDSRALDDIDRLVAYLSQPKYRNRQIVLVGFTDNTGSLVTNNNLSKQRANSVKDILRNKGVEISNTIGMGPLRPSRDNATEFNRSFNRRVEVWIQ
jgi:phosphate transport system substrate-binding protein